MKDNYMYPMYPMPGRDEEGSYQAGSAPMGGCPMMNQMMNPMVSPMMMNPMMGPMTSPMMSPMTGCPFMNPQMNYPMEEKR